MGKEKTVCARKHWAKCEIRRRNTKHLDERRRRRKKRNGFFVVTVRHTYTNRNSFAPRTGSLFWIICHSFLGFACYSFSPLYLCAHKYMAVALQIHQNRLHAISLSYCFPKKEKHSLFSFRGSSSVYQCRPRLLKSLWISNLFRNKPTHGWHANGIGPSKCTRTSSLVLMERTRGDCEMSAHTHSRHPVRVLNRSDANRKNELEPTTCTQTVVVNVLGLVSEDTFIYNLQHSRKHCRFCSQLSSLPRPASASLSELMSSNPGCIASSLAKQIDYNESKTKKMCWRRNSFHRVRSVPISSSNTTNHKSSSNKRRAFSVLEFFKWSQRCFQALTMNDQYPSPFN